MGLMVLANHTSRTHKGFAFSHRKQTNDILGTAGLSREISAEIGMCNNKPSGETRHGEIMKVQEASPLTNMVLYSCALSSNVSED